MLFMNFAGIYISSIANNTMHKSLRSLWVFKTSVIGYLEQAICTFVASNLE